MIKTVTIASVVWQNTKPFPQFNTITVQSCKQSRRFIQKKHFLTKYKQLNCLCQLDNRRLRAVAAQGSEVGGHGAQLATAGVDSPGDVDKASRCWASAHCTAERPCWWRGWL